MNTTNKVCAFLHCILLLIILQGCSTKKNVVTTIQKIPIKEDVSLSLFNIINMLSELISITISLSTYLDNLAPHRLEVKPNLYFV